MLIHFSQNIIKGNKFKLNIYFKIQQKKLSNQIRKMAIPDAFNGSISDLHYYQGVIIAEVAVTLAVYVVLKIIHYVKWGAAEEQEAGPVEGAKKDVSAEEDTTTRKWEQKIWDVYFPIIYTNHMAGLALSLCYIPYVFAAIIAYIHFAAFLALVIVNIFIKDAEPGNGNRTKASRVLWLIMCVLNIVQIITGLTGVAKVLP